MPDTGPSISPDRRKRTETEMHQWIVMARRMIHDDFTGNEVELQRLIIQTACTFMVQDKVVRVLDSLDEIKVALNLRNGS